MREKISIRQLQGNEEFLACENLEKETWGQSFAECVPPSILMISQKIGGVTAGAFNQEDELVGFVYGLTGVMDGKLVHWSHMLAVQPQYRDRNLGARLKHFQAKTVKALGVGVIFWTFDPLVSKNAHLNLNKLNVEVDKYVPEMYIDGNESDLHRGLGMDRFVVKWELTSKQTLDESVKSIDPETDQTIVINTKRGEDPEPTLVEPNLVKEEKILIEIPLDINEIQNRSLKLAGQWRENTRKCFLHYLEKKYSVSGFYRKSSNNRCFYILTQDS